MGGTLALVNVNRPSEPAFSRFSCPAHCRAVPQGFAGFAEIPRIRVVGS